MAYNIAGPLVYVLSLGLLGVILGSTPAEAQPFAYVTNFENNTVSVIATATNTVVATVPVGSFPAFWGRFFRRHGHDAPPDQGSEGSPQVWKPEATALAARRPEAGALVGAMRPRS